MQKNRDEFIDYKVNEKHNQPPYFKMMEKYNQQGPPMNELAQILPALTVDRFQTEMDNGMQVIDTRSPEAIAGLFLPGSLAIPLKMIPAYAGWLLSYDRSVGLIVESPAPLTTALRHLYRLGYDTVGGYLAGGMHAWEIQGRKFDSIGVIHAEDLRQMIERDHPFTLLDVRSESEYEQKRLPNAVNIYVGHLPSHIDRVPRDKPVVTFCNSGRRAMIAASILKMNGFTEVSNCMGSMKACAKIGCTFVS